MNITKNIQKVGFFIYIGFLHTYFIEQLEKRLIKGRKFSSYLLENTFVAFQTHFR